MEEQKTIIRKMELADLDAVYKIEESSFRVPWSYNAMEEDIKNPLTYYAVAEVDGQVCAFAGMWLVSGDAHLTNVAVSEAHRQSGIGTTLMRHMMQEGKNRDMNFMWLEVRQSNSAAQMMYERLGFVQCGLRKKYYMDTKEDALVLFKRL